MKVLEKRFHLNGHISGFRPQIHKLEPGYETPSFILAVKGLKARSTLKKNDPSTGLPGRNKEFIPGGRSN